MPSLAFPKCVSLIVGGKNQQASLGNAFRFKGITGSVNKLFTNSFALVFRQHDGMVDIAAPAIVPGENSAYDLAAKLHDKTGGRVAFQELQNALFAVIQAAKPS